MLMRQVRNVTAGPLNLLLRKESVLFAPDQERQRVYGQVA
jgi:hypothetical protein